MWSPLSNLLESLARLRLPWVARRQVVRVGDPSAPDYLGTRRWRDYLEPQALSRAWGPRDAGPWRPFHSLALFASVDYLEHRALGPLEEDPLPLTRVLMPDWLDAKTLLLVDLKGPQSVALGAALAALGCDLVCTFNNWPHPKGLIASERTLAALLRYASWLTEKRRWPETPAPVAWLCDAERLGTRPGKPGEFDNRYYIEDSVLPGPRYLRERGISRVVYLTTEGQKVLADLGEHLHRYRQDGFEVLGTTLFPDGGFGALAPLDLKAARFSTLGYLMAAGGGFGATVPHPSSGG